MINLLRWVMVGLQTLHQVRTQGEGRSKVRRGARRVRVRLRLGGTRELLLEEERRTRMVGERSRKMSRRVGREERGIKEEEEEGGKKVVGKRERGQLR